MKKIILILIVIVLVCRCAIAGEKPSNIYADTRTVTVAGHVTTTCSGFIAYEKPDRFRMVNTSVVDGTPSLDLGADGANVWIWSTRWAPRFTHLCKRSSINSITEANFINPYWFTECLGINKQEGIGVPFSGGLAYQSTGGNKIRTVLTDSSGVFQAFLVHNRGGRSELRADALQTNKDDVTTVLHIKWSANNMDITLTLSNIRLNSRMSTTLWDVPRNHEFREIR